MKVVILGQGQLAQLLTHAAYPLGIQVQTICTTESNLEKILALSHDCDAMTFENENIDTELLKRLSIERKIYPSPENIRIAQDRWLEKTFFESLNIPCVKYLPIDSLETLEAGILKTGLPAVLKTRRFGYDGKGQSILRSPSDAKAAWESIGKVPAILEAFIDFDCEVSLIAARNPDGQMIFYPLIKNTHQDGILRTSESPYEHHGLFKQAETYMRKLLLAFDYVGVLAFEFFVQGENLIANEIAPRVHNSGHLTTEGFNVSQFESHLRSVLNLPLIQPVLRTPTVMRNIIGTFAPLTREEYHNAHIYDYGKTERPGRKLGHVVYFGNLKNIQR